MMHSFERKNVKDGDDAHFVIDYSALYLTTGTITKKVYNHR